MSINSGFYDSKNHDREYSTLEMGSIFDGIIRDGVYSSIGEKFIVTVSHGMEVLVGSGRAWFNHSWLTNDTKYPIQIPAAESVLKRIDAIVIEINRNTNVRNGRIFVKKGTPSSNPQHPSMTQNAEISQHPVAWVKVNPGVNTIYQQDIINLVGKSECPFVTGVLSTVNTNELVKQWEAQFEILFGELKAKTDQVVQGTIPDGSVSSTYYVDVLYDHWWNEGSIYHKEFKVPGMTANDNPIVDIDFSKISTEDEKLEIQEQWSMVYNIVPGNGNIIIYTSDHIQKTIPIKILCVRK